MAEPRAPQPDMTVLVATRNRAHELVRALQHLAAQQTGGRFTYEVLVVDNGSTDGTKALVERMQPAFPTPLRYFYEERAGKSWALNAGLREARGLVVAFTDDDVETEAGWLAALWSCFADTGADAVGGKILPRWTGGYPAWLDDPRGASFIFGALGCVDHGPSRLVSTPEAYHYWVGGNAAIRRRLADEIGAFSTHMTRGQDTEYGLRCVRRGKTLVYEPAAVAHHRIGPERLTPAFFRRWWHQRGRYRAYRTPWRLSHLVTVEPLSWYADLARCTLQWIAQYALRRPFVDRLWREVRVRERFSEWWHRLLLLPGIWAAVLRRGPQVLGTGKSYVELFPDAEFARPMPQTVPWTAVRRLLLAALLVAVAAGAAVAMLLDRPLDAAARLWLSRVGFCYAVGVAALLAAILRGHVAQAVRSFFSEVEHPFNLAVFRVVVFTLLFWMSDLERLRWFSEVPADLRILPWGSKWWLFTVIPINADWATAAWAGLRAACLLAIVGLWTRASAAVATVLAIYVLGIPQLFGKVHHYHHLVWFAALLAAGRCGDALSIDALRAAWRRADRGVTVPPGPSRAYALPIRFAWILMGIMYLFPGFWKWWTSGVDWVIGSNLTHYLYAKWTEQGGWMPAWRVDRVPLLMQLTALGTLVFELGFLWGIFLPRLRPVLAVSGVAFHEGIRYVMRINFRTLQLCYVTFVDWARVLRGLGERLFREPLTVLYDGNCELCRRTIALVRVFDVLERTVYLNALDDEALRRHGLDALDRQALLEDMHAVSSRGRWRGFDAYRQVAWRMPLLWPTLPLLHLWPVTAIGRRIYRRVADHRACSIVQPAPAGAVPAPAPAGAAVAAVGIFLIAGNAWYGVRGLSSAWPLACYPTFRLIVQNPEVSTLQVATVDAAGREQVLDARLMERQATTGRWKNLIGSIMQTGDEALRRERLRQLWALWAREDAALQAAQMVRFYKVTRSTVPEAADDPPLRRELLWEMTMTEGEPVEDHVEAS